MLQEVAEVNGGTWFSDAAEWVSDHGFSETWHGITSIGLRFYFYFEISSEWTSVRSPLLCQ